MGVCIARAALKRAVFFDRDGVLNAAIIRNGRPHPPDCVDDLVLDPAAATCLGMLCAAGFLLIVVTNQPDVARGRTKRETIMAINERVRSELPVAEIYTCFHDTQDDCACRKPRPGLLFAAARRYAIDLSTSYLVGDRWSDVEAGRAAGCRTAWIERGYDERAAENPDMHSTSLKSACDWILHDRNA